MLFVVRFTDRPGIKAQRENLMAEHHSWIVANRWWVLLAGSMRAAPGADAVGGLWIVEAETPEAIKDLIKSEPFWAHGLRADMEIYLWGMATPDMHHLGQALADYSGHRHFARKL